MQPTEDTIISTCGDYKNYQWASLRCSVRMEPVTAFYESARLHLDIRISSVRHSHVPGVDSSGQLSSRSPFPTRFSAMHMDMHTHAGRAPSHTLNKHKLRRWGSEDEESLLVPEQLKV